MKLKILIVDDTLHILEEVKDILEMENFEVFIANSVWKALDLVYKKLPDLIITDLKMPEQSGFDLLKEIKSNPKSRHIPIVILTANADQENIKMALKLDAANYLKKPCSADELIDTINTTLQKYGKTENHIS